MYWFDAKNIKNWATSHGFPWLRVEIQFVLMCYKSHRSFFQKSKAVCLNTSRHDRWIISSGYGIFKIITCKSLVLFAILRGSLTAQASKPRAWTFLTSRDLLSDLGFQEIQHTEQREELDITNHELKDGVS